MSTKTQQFSRSTALPVSAAEAFQWHARPGAFERLAPPWSDVRMLSEHQGIAEGTRVELSMPVGPLRVRWQALHDRCVPGVEFRDVQEKGPFRLWEHTHAFSGDAARGATDRSIMEDSIEYVLPLGALGAAFAGGTIRDDLERTFTYRHRVTADDLRQHGAAALAPARIAVTGATGLIGAALVPFLTTGGHRVVTVGRSEGCDVGWDALAAGASEGLGALDGCDAVVHLAGANIAAGRWTERRKDEIRESRVCGTTALCRALARLERPPRVLVCASAVGLYGTRRHEAEIDESAAPGAGFLSEVCVGWEEATEAAVAAGIRVVHLRFGVVLSAGGGALQRMLLPYRLGAGGRLGSGTQPMSWIALDDALGIVLHALTHEDLTGPVNAVAPEIVTNSEYTAVLARVLGRPAIAPVPAPLVSALFGEMGRELLLGGARVVPARLESTGYAFRHAGLEDALRHTLGRVPAPR